MFCPVDYFAMRYLYKSTPTSRPTFSLNLRLNALVRLGQHQSQCKHDRIVPTRPLNFNMKLRSLCALYHILLFNHGTILFTQARKPERPLQAFVMVRLEDTFLI